MTTDFVLPSRIQRSRRKGSRQPPNTKYCGRPTKWGNPFVIGEDYTRESSMEAFRHAFWSRKLPMTPGKIYRKLRKYDYLSCWCSLDEECHVDEYIKAIELKYAKRREICLYCPHRLKYHYKIEMLNELDEVHAFGAACHLCNTTAPSDLHSDGLYLFLPTK